MYRNDQDVVFYSFEMCNLTPHAGTCTCLCTLYQGLLLMYTQITTYLHVGVIRSIGKSPACMYSVNLYLSGLGRLHIFCESTLQWTPLGDLDNVFWIVKYTISCIIFLIVWKLVSFCIKFLFYFIKFFLLSLFFLHIYNCEKYIT